MQLTKKPQFLITLIITALVWAHVVWDHFHGGIPVHYLFQDENMPGIPNWVGAIVLPFFAWFLLDRIKKRLDASDSGDTVKKKAIRFFAGLLFAIAISICFLNDIMVVDYLMGAVFLLAFIFPLYKSEYVLGWVIGATYTFGAIIPIAFGSLLCLLFFLFYLLAKWIRTIFQKKA